MRTRHLQRLDEIIISNIERDYERYGPSEQELRERLENLERWEKAYMKGQSVFDNQFMRHLLRVTEAMSKFLEIELIKEKLEKGENYERQ